MNSFNATLIDPNKKDDPNRDSPKLDAEELRQKLYKLSSCSSDTSNRGSIDENIGSDDPIEYYEYFMNMAKMVSRKKKNKKQRAGACIVNSKNKIIGIGHYSHLKTAKPEFLSWFRNSNEESYMCHAEMNAIINKTESLENSILFVTQFPCIECTKMIVQSGIKKIIYSNKSEHNCQKISNDEEQTAKKIFELSNVMYISI